MDLNRFEYRRFKRVATLILLQMIVGSMARIAIRIFITWGFIEVFNRFGWYSNVFMSVVSTAMSWLIGRFVVLSAKRVFNWDDDFGEIIDDLIDAGFEILMRIKKHFEKG